MGAKKSKKDPVPKAPAEEKELDAYDENIYGDVEPDYDAEEREEEKEGE